MDYHQPVLLNEIVKLLDPNEDKVFIDATLGHAGHTIELLKAGATVYGIEQDPYNLEIATTRIKDLNIDKNFIPVHGNFVDTKKLIPPNRNIDGLLLDLGLSKNQQKSSNRGFSFNDELSLDMRLDPKTQSVSAENLINTADYQTLYDIFTKYAQENYSKPLIVRIITERQKSPIKTGQRLADIIRNFYLEKHLHISIDPATKIFMALRIAINDEFVHLKSLLSDSLEIIRPGGTVCVISFHSGEDRIVKNFIRGQKITSMVTKPDRTEILQNPLSRSATLRSYKINQ